MTIAASCGITLRRARRPVTVSSSDATARAVDEIQYDGDQGPCLEALSTGRVVIVTDLADEQRWNGYPARALAHAAGPGPGRPRSSRRRRAARTLLTDSGSSTGTMATWTGPTTTISGPTRARRRPGAGRGTQWCCGLPRLRGSSLQPDVGPDQVAGRKLIRVHGSPAPGWCVEGAPGWCVEGRGHALGPQAFG